MTRLWLSFAALAACTGNDVEPSCVTSYLTYDNFGEPFMTSWCRGCHSDQVAAPMRQRAPLGVDFDTLDEVRVQSISIAITTVTDRTMPPAGGPSDEERAMLDQWLRCGAR
jgi:uncharacterized membrane protein